MLSLAVSQFGTHVKEDHKLIAQGGVYMAQLGDVQVGCDFDKSCATACCAGFGCCRQEITGAKDSVAFLSAGGTIIYKQLGEGETVTVDTRSVVAFEESVTLGITPNGRCGMWFCGGEGCFSTTLTGPGKVFMQVCNNWIEWFLFDNRTLDSSRLHSSLEHEFPKIQGGRHTNDRRGRAWRRGPIRWYRECRVIWCCRTLRDDSFL